VLLLVLPFYSVSMGSRKKLAIARLRAGAKRKRTVSELRQ
jgi:hypothetical protein